MKKYRENSGKAVLQKFDWNVIGPFSIRTSGENSLDHVFGRHMQKIKLVVQRDSIDESVVSYWIRVRIAYKKIGLTR